MWHISHVLWWVCAGYTLALRCFGGRCVLAQLHRGQTHNMHPHVASWTKHTARVFIPPIPSLVCAGLVTTDNPLCWFSVCVLLNTAAGLVPFDQSGVYPWTMVVLVASTPSVGWSSWWAPARVPMNHTFSQRSTTLATGQGGNALLKDCLTPKTSVGQIVSNLVHPGT